jgi:hypothetical protein
MYEAARNIDLTQVNIQSVSSISSRLHLVIRNFRSLDQFGSGVQKRLSKFEKKTSYVNYLTYLLTE